MPYGLKRKQNFRELNPAVGADAHPIIVALGSDLDMLFGGTDLAIRSPACLF